jgi:hypothetical protein
LYHAVEREAATLLSYLTTKYGDKFSKELYKMLPRQSKSAIRPTRENLDELSGTEIRNEVNLDYTAEDVDSRIGTNLAFKNYVFPTGYPEDRVKDIILKGSDKDKKEAFDNIISINNSVKNISNIKNITDDEYITYILTCMVKKAPPEDIKFYIEQFAPKEKGESQDYVKFLDDEIQTPYDIAIGWMPSGNNMLKIVSAIKRKKLKRKNSVAK